MQEENPIHDGVVPWEKSSTDWKPNAHKNAQTLTENRTKYSLVQNKGITTTPPAPPVLKKETEK